MLFFFFWPRNFFHFLQSLLLFPFWVDILGSVALHARAPSGLRMHTAGFLVDPPLALFLAPEFVGLSIIRKEMLCVHSAVWMSIGMVIILPKMEVTSCFLG